MNDNADGPGSLNGGGTTATAVSNGGGRVSVTLRVTDHAAGDNYQIEATTDPAFDCSKTPCTKSDVYTAWKRVYVEVHKMFRSGTFLREPLAAGSKVIVVDGTGGLPRPPFTLRLIHAARVEDAVADFYSEDVDVMAVRDNPGGGRQLILRGEADPAVPGVSHAYMAEERVRGILRPYLRDAVGVVTGNRARDYFLANCTFVNRLFDAAFVEYVWLTDAAGGTDGDLLPEQPRLPFDGLIPLRARRIGDADPSEREWLARKWIRNVSRPSPGERDANPNHQALFAAWRHGRHDDGGTLLGVTVVADQFNDAWVFIGEMGNANLRGEATIHELTHQWKVNQKTPSGADAGGHCDLALRADQFMFNRRALRCVMTSGINRPDEPEARDGIVAYHYVSAGGARDSEYLHIRRRAEPVPQNEEMGRNPR